TFCFDLTKVIYIYRTKQILPSFIHSNLIWNGEQGFSAFKTLSNDVIIADEVLFIADRREAMNYINIKYLQFLNLNASKHNVILTNGQDWTDIDDRIKKKMDILVLISKTGIIKVLAKSLSYPIVKIPIISTDKFEKAPYLLKDERADYEISRDPNYIFKTKFWQ